MTGKYPLLFSRPSELCTEKTRIGEQLRHRWTTHRASTRASSPSIPMTACGVFASITYTRRRGVRGSEWYSRRSGHRNSRSDYRNVGSTHRSPHKLSCPCGTPSCTFYRRKSSRPSAQADVSVSPRDIRSSRTTPCSKGHGWRLGRLRCVCFLKEGKSRPGVSFPMRCPFRGTYHIFWGEENFCFGKVLGHSRRQSIGRET